MSVTVVRNGQVCSSTGVVNADLVIEGEYISSLVEPGTPVEAAAHVFDASGCLLLPGLVDMHVHLREPGDEEAEDIRSGCAAAVAGGFTDIVAMPNTHPPQDSVGVVEFVREAAARAGLCRVHPAGCVTRARAGKELAGIRELAEAGVVIFTDDGDPVRDSRIMRRALEYVGFLGGLVADHCEDTQLTDGAQMNEGEVSGWLGLAGWPSVAEEIFVARDILLAEYTGSRVHLQHLSTAGAVRLVRDAKARGVMVSAEVTPHHLMLTDEKATEYDPVFKVNPPLRTAADRAAVRLGLADGTIDIVATDHAPHTPENKEEWTEARCGMLGLETALPLVWDLHRKGDLTLERLVDAMSSRPAHLAGLEPRGPLAAGQRADLCVFDMEHEWVVDPSGFHGKSRNTPYEGMTCTGRVRYTFVDGRPVFHADEKVGENKRPGRTAFLVEEGVASEGPTPRMPGRKK